MRSSPYHMEGRRFPPRWLFERLGIPGSCAFGLVVAVAALVGAVPSAEARLNHAAFLRLADSRFGQAEICEPTTLLIPELEARRVDWFSASPNLDTAARPFSLEISPSAWHIDLVRFAMPTGVGWLSRGLEAGLSYRLADVRGLLLLSRYATPERERITFEQRFFANTLGAERRPLMPSLAWNAEANQNPSALTSPVPRDEPIVPSPRCRERRHRVVIRGLGGQGASLALLDCDGAIAVGALDQLSLLARAPIGAAPELPLPLQPNPEAAYPEEWVPSVRLLHPRLLWLLDRLSRRFPGHPIQIYSGYRREPEPSPHRDGRALDLSLVGVSNHDLYLACRSLPNVACGFYPFHPFVHVDVRSPEQGSAWWTDLSRPGEPSMYVDVGPAQVLSEYPPS
jgi:hypothetical protein